MRKNNKRPLEYRIGDCLGRLRILFPNKDQQQLIAALEFHPEYPLHLDKFDISDKRTWEDSAADAMEGWLEAVGINMSSRSRDIGWIKKDWNPIDHPDFLVRTQYISPPKIEQPIQPTTAELRKTVIDSIKASNRRVSL